MKAGSYSALLYMAVRAGSDLLGGVHLCVVCHMLNTHMCTSHVLYLHFWAALAWHTWHCGAHTRTYMERCSTENIHVHHSVYYYMQLQCIIMYVCICELYIFTLLYCFIQTYTHGIGHLLCVHEYVSAYTHIYVFSMQCMEYHTATIQILVYMYTCTHTLHYSYYIATGIVQVIHTQIQHWAMIGGLGLFPGTTPLIATLSSIQFALLPVSFKLLFLPTCSTTPSRPI